MVSGKARSVNSTDVYRDLDTSIHKVTSEETQEMTEMSIFVFISDPDCPVSDKPKRCLLKHHVKLNGSESINGTMLTQSRMASDHIYYDPVKNERFLDGENNPLDWATLWKMDVHWTGGHWAVLGGIKAKQNDDMDADCSIG